MQKEVLNLRTILYMENIQNVKQCVKSPLGTVYMCVYLFLRQKWLAYRNQEQENRCSLAVLLEIR